MKNISLFIFITLVSPWVLASDFNGKYVGETGASSGKQPCTVEIYKYSFDGEYITAKFRSSLQDNQKAIFNGRGINKGFNPGQVSAFHNTKKLEESTFLYFFIDPAERTPTKLLTLNYYSYDYTSDQTYDEVCTYLKKID